MSRRLLATLLAASGLLCPSCARAPLSAPGLDSAPLAIRETLAHGASLAQQGTPQEAVAVYREAVERERGAVPAHLRYVSSMLKLGRRTEVRAYYEQRAAGADATHAERTMAERLGTSGASSALRRVYTVAAQREQDSPWWQLALAEVEIAEGDAWNLRREEAIDRGDQPAERQAFAQARGALRRANRAVERAARRAPVLAEVELYRGYLRATEGDLHAAAPARTAAYGAAEDAFIRAVTLDPDLVEAWAGLGDVRFRTKELDDSLKAYLQAARRAPLDADLRESLGVVLHELGRYVEAAAQYEEAARLRPWDASPLLRLGDALADDERWQDALDAYDKALRRDPDVVEAHYKMGTVLEHLDRPGAARAAFERYVEQGGTRAGAVERRIERLLRQEGR